MNDSTWTWISGNIESQKGNYGKKGKSSMENIPGARWRSLGYYDSNADELWLFGGKGFNDEEFGA